MRLRAAVVCVLLLGAVQCFSQIPVWRTETPGTYNNKIVRDASGYLYVVSLRQPTPYLRFFVVSKLDPLGHVVYEQEVYGNSVVEGYKTKVNSVATTGQRLYIQATDFKGPSQFSTQIVLAVNTTTGGRDWVQISGSYEGRDLALQSNGRPLVVGVLHGNVPADDRGYIQALNISDGTVAWTRTFGVFENQLNKVVVGSGNVAYATGWTMISGKRQLQIAGCTSGGSLKFDNNFVPTGVDVAEGLFIGVDDATDRIYAAGEGWSGSAPQRTFLRVSRISDLGQVSSRYIADADDTVTPIGMLVNGSGAYLSTRFDSFDQDSNLVRRYTTTGAIAFSKTFANAYFSATPMAFDSAGDLFLARSVFTGTDSNTRLLKLAGNNGVIKMDAEYDAGSNEGPADLVRDAANNVYMTGNFDFQGNSYVAKFQQAALTIPTPVIGGTQVTATITLASPAPAGGAQFTLSSNKPDATVQGTTWVNAGETTKNFYVTTTPVSTNTSVTINATYDNFVVQTQFSLAAPAALSVTISPNSVFGGVNTAGIVTLDGMAPLGGKQVFLSSSDTNSATVPASVWVNAGTKSAGFTIATKPVSVNKGVVITATTGVVSRTAFMAVNAPWLINFTVSPTSLKGGNPATLTLTLNGRAPAGYSVQLVSGSETLVTVPSSTFMTQNATAKSVGITTHGVTSATNVTLIAYRGPYVRTCTITLTP